MNTTLVYFLSLALTLGSFDATVDPNSSMSREEQYVCYIEDFVRAHVPQDPLEDQALAWCLTSAWRDFAETRIIPVTIPQRDTAWFGPWKAQEDFLATDARADGSLTEWYDDYYITHDWSEIGQQILTLIPGDTVQVNGRLICIDSICNYPKDSYYEEIMAIAGEESVVFQTCYPDSDYNRIAWGHVI